jgi:hypothetical protein
MDGKLEIVSMEQSSIKTLVYGVFYGERHGWDGRALRWRRWSFTVDFTVTVIRSIPNRAPVRHHRI